MAGFQVIIYGRIWVITEGHDAHLRASRGWVVTLKVVEGIPEFGRLLTHCMEGHTLRRPPVSFDRTHEAAARRAVSAAIGSPVIPHPQWPQDMDHSPTFGLLT